MAPPQEEGASEKPVANESSAARKIIVRRLTRQVSPIVSAQARSATNLDGGAFNGGAGAVSSEIKIRGDARPEFPWQLIIDRINEAMYDNGCHVPRDYQIIAELNAKQQIILTRRSSTGDSKADLCTDQQLQAIAKTTVGGQPYHPRVVSIDIRRKNRGALK